MSPLDFKINEYRKDGPPFIALQHCFTATLLPSRSVPSYTVPKPPSPNTLLKRLVASSSSLNENLGGNPGSDSKNASSSSSNPTPLRRRTTTAMTTHKLNMTNKTPLPIPTTNIQTLVPRRLWSVLIGDEMAAHSVQVPLSHSI
jgi:hypothetical protein